MKTTQTIIDVIVALSFLNLIYLYVFTVEKKKFLGFLFLTWLSTFACYIFLLPALNNPSILYSSISIGFFIAGSYTFVIGVYSFINIKTPRWLVHVYLIKLIISMLLLQYNNKLLLLTAVLLFLFISILYVYLGIQFFKYSKTVSGIKKITGCLIFGWAIYHLAFPACNYLIPAYNNSIVHLAGAILRVTLAAGILLVYFQELREEKTYLSYHDTLTGLYNRTYFEEQIKHLDYNSKLPVSIIMGDVNGLKFTNDTFGHMEGDKLLKNIADVFKSSCNKNDIVARYGGDEFIVLQPETNASDAEKTVLKIKTSLKLKENTPVRPSISLGISVKKNHEQSMDFILKQAEDHMYRNKLMESKSIRNSLIMSFEKMLREKDYQTEEHVKRLHKLALHLGECAHLSNSELNELLLLAALHDIGKIAVPEEVLKKKGRLSQKEWKIIKTHCEVGYRIAKSTPELSHVAKSILYHHERWDGNGYPHGIKGKNIPRISRILSIIDAYDVMTHERPYKKPISKSDAINELKRCSGSQFDPELTELFIKKISQN